MMNTLSLLKQWAGPKPLNNQENPFEFNSQRDFLLYLKICTLFSNGGGKEDRTPDLMIANHSLSQLSYTPNMRSNQKPPLRTVSKLVEVSGIEPLTF